MGQECREAMFRFVLDHRHLKSQECRDAYYAEAERKMLDDLIRAHLRAPIAA
jgi:hypothetical protein